MEKKTFTVEGMKCHNCEAHVEEALKELEGIVEVKANHETNSIEVEYDANNVTPGKMKEVVDDLGRYEMTL